VIGINSPNLDVWIPANVPGLSAPFNYELIKGGHSNLTYKVTDAEGSAVVLRRPPTGSILATAHNMEREHRIISAVGRTPVPVPRTLSVCTDLDVNDAPFYLMEYVVGDVLHDASFVAPALPHRDSRHTLGMHVVEVLAQLHATNPSNIGLGDLSRPGGYVERQLKRWKRQWDSSKQREIPDMETAYAGLVARLPDQQSVNIVHGDYRLGNMLVSPAGRIAAVLDWELCTLGDPLADLGYLLNTWAGEGEDAPEGIGMAPTSVGGFPSREEMVDAYEAATGIDVIGIEYYRSFQYWRLAAIIEGVYARYLQGAMADTDADIGEFGRRVVQLAEDAVRMLEALEQ
jgi:aminoglycoside phosphotransferase (APT) family kinase protein